ncbi:MAG: DUF4350 domain-containing protein [Myxococcota bacterium]
MTRARWWLALGVLVALALAVGLAVGPDASDRQVPSVTSSGPKGLLVLATWLRETGVDVRAGDEPLTEIPPDVATVVLPSPTAAEVTDDEVKALRRFVERGGTLVALLPRGPAQARLKRWLSARAGEVAPLSDVPGVRDLGGSTVAVRISGGALAHVAALRVSGEVTVTLDDEAAVPVTDPPALWWRALGRGEVWVSMGPDLAENARLELLDNAAFWAAVGRRGPMWIDEFHHQRRLDTAPPLHFVTTALQAGLLALLFVVARGTRLGPPREEPRQASRSASEYVTAMAALTARAGVEAELVAALKTRLRRTLHDALGISTSISWDEAARQATQRSALRAELVRAAGAEIDFLALSRAAAEIERELGGEGSA